VDPIEKCGEGPDRHPRRIGAGWRLSLIACDGRSERKLNDIEGVLIMLSSFPAIPASARLLPRPGKAWPACLGMIVGLLLGCSKQPAPPPPAAAEVTAITVAQKDTPVDLEFVAQTQSSREVEIRARVEGFLDKRLYTEGQPVRAGQILFQMDRKPFEAALQSAKGQLEQQKARLGVAQQNLARVRPLAEQNAVSRKDLDDAVGNEQQARAAVFAAEGQVRTAQLNLSYTTISSPLNGLSSYAKMQEGSYVTPGEAGLLTYVSQVDPMWVNFSVSENELLKYRAEVDKGRLRFPPNSEFDVEVVLGDGTVFPNHGRINFIAPSFSKETGTFLIRTEVANPEGTLKPGQFVRARVIGAVRPDAILVPRRAVLQGAKSHYVWVIDKDGKARERVVDVGEWLGDDWFINQGLRAGERMVADGAIRVSPGAPLKVVEKPAAGLAGAKAAGAGQTGGDGSTGSGSPASGPGKSADKPR
jgi:membrane fusion protein (multidrug efflux system)